MMDGSAGGPGAPGQSMQEAGSAGGPGQPPPAAAEAGAAGGPGAAPAGKAKTEAELVAMDKKAGKPDAELVAMEKGDKKPEAVLKAGEKGPRKPDAELIPGEAGTSGGPGAPKSPAAKDADDEDLVDPDADRPNFGGAGPAEDGAEDSDEDDAFASVAARAGGKAAKQEKRLGASKPINPAYLMAAGMGAAVLGLALLIWMGREILMDVWPAASGFYQSVGAAPKSPGEGLKIAESAKRLQRIGGVETLVVKGFISNIGEIPRPVPKLKLQLYNQKKEVIQDADGAAPATLLDPGATVEFEVRMPLPQITAAKGGYAVVWNVE